MDLKQSFTVFKAQTHSLDADSLALSSVEVVGGARQLLEVDIGADVHLARVDLHDTCARLLVGVGELDLPVETTGTQQRRVQDVHSVGGCYHLISIAAVLSCLMRQTTA